MSPSKDDLFDTTQIKFLKAVKDYNGKAFKGFRNH